MSIGKSTMWWSTQCQGSTAVGLSVSSIGYLTSWNLCQETGNETKYACARERSCHPERCLTTVCTTLFLVAINQLLKQLEQLNKGVMCMLVRSHTDTDDIVTNMLTALKARIETVSLCTSQNCPKITVTKCKLLTTDPVIDDWDSVCYKARL